MSVKIILFSMFLVTAVSAYGYGGKSPVHRPVRPTPYRPNPTKYIPTTTKYVPTTTKYMTKTTKYVPKQKPVVHQVSKPKPFCYGYKKLMHRCDYGYPYGYGSYNYNKPGYFYSTCRKLDYEDNRGKCEYSGQSGGYGNTYRRGYGLVFIGCKSHYCRGYAYKGQSKCHGKVELSKGYYYMGEQCNNENGSCGYKSYLGYNRENCSCETRTCSKLVKACYKHGDYYYVGYVKIEYQCGCGCSVAPNRYHNGG